MDQFQKLEQHPFTFYVHRELHARGIRHGFIDGSVDFSETNRDRLIPHFKETFNVQQLYTLQQIHSPTIIDASVHEPQCGDGYFISQSRPGVAYGIKTADCVPLIMVSSSACAVVHAGWRGIAQGIIEGALQKFPSTESLHVLIGPCAGYDRYEVGSEVIDALHPKVISKPLGEKFLLDLQGTARRRVQEAHPHAAVSVLPICTITDTAFHSHRRQGMLKGSNLTFIAFPYS